MASNPDWQDPNRNVSDSTINKRTFDFDNDAIRVNVVEPIELKVEDIQIGAVEIKDGETDTRASVITQGTTNALVVRTLVEQVKTTVNSFGSAIVNPGITLTLASYTITAGNSFTFQGGIVGGNGSGEFHFEVDGNDIALVRNSGAQPTIKIKFPEPQKISTPVVVNIKVKNIGHTSQPFEATLSGYNVPL